MEAGTGTGRASDIESWQARPPLTQVLRLVTFKFCEVLSSKRETLVTVGCYRNYDCSVIIPLVLQE